MEDNKEQQKKSKYGRKKADNPKINRFTVRYSNADFERLNGYFKKSSANSLSEFVELVSLKEFNTLRKERPEILQFKAEIRKIGINVNQIAKQVNTTFGHLNMKEITTKLEEIEGELRKLLKEMAK